MKPSVRVSWTRQVVAALEDGPAGARDGVVASVSETTMRAVEGAKRIGWIGLTAHMEVCESINTALGPDGCREHFCAATVRSGRGTLFGPLVDGFVALFGPSPASTVRAAPRAWGFIFRGVGKLEVGPTDGRSVQVSLRGLHPSIRDTETFAIGVLGALDACLVFVQRTGTVEMDTGALSNGRVLYRLGWDER